MQLIFLTRKIRSNISLIMNLSDELSCENTVSCMHESSLMLYEDVLRGKDYV